MESEVMYGDKGEVPEEEYYIEIGKANVIKEGTDVTIVSFGKMITRVVNPAVEALTKEGISVELIDLRTVRPIDYETILISVKKTNRLVIVEEAWPLASISSEIAFNVQKNAFDYLDAPVLRITCADVPLPYAPTLIAESLPNPERVINAVKSVMYVKK
jgi:pyruvate dehydrogenase E1 component beta subunit